MTDLEEKIYHIGKSLNRSAAEQGPGLFNKDYWQDRLLQWSMKDPQFKVDLFRFVDVLPMLSSSDSVADHIKQYLLKKNRKLPAILQTALKAATLGSFAAAVSAKAIKKNVVEMAGKFIAGAQPDLAIDALKKMHGKNIYFTVDLLGEKTLSQKEAMDYQHRYLSLIDTLTAHVDSWLSDDFFARDHFGQLPKKNISIKLSALEPYLDAANIYDNVVRLKEKVLPIFYRAIKTNTFVNIDLEDFSLHDTSFALLEELLAHSKIKNWPNIGIVIQAYLKCSEKDVDRLIYLARAKKSPLGVRLVKGAYWDYEVINAQQHGFCCPVFTDKASTDLQYEKLTTKLLHNIDLFRPAFASHNLRSLSHVIAKAQQLGLSKNSYEIQMLYGMAGAQAMALVNDGHRARVYCPVGELLPGMSYLVRRLLENTSNVGFLRLANQQESQVEQLLQKPQLKNNKIDVAGKNNADFANCPLSDFSLGAARSKFAAAVQDVKSQLPIVISGEQKNKPFVHCCPSDSKSVVTQCCMNTAADVDAVVHKANKSFAEWQRSDLDRRVLLLQKLADLLQRDRYYLAALQCYEVAKPWHEADADVAEAIDFCRYYADRAQIELCHKKQGSILGEENILSYQGRGVCLVIAPWNFPLAILCGMSVAALVAGNSVIMKPAEQSMATAHEFYKRMLEAGFAEGVINFFPGIGEEVGPSLVAHKDIAQIVFTGSKEVGQQIATQAAKVVTEQRQLKRVIAEMGGKNAIIIDDDADLDEAVLGVVGSAFAFAGQKCSACSRVIVLEDIYESFVVRLLEAIKSIIYAPADDSKCILGPVIDKNSFDRLNAIIDNNKDQILFKGQAPEGGYFVPATVFLVDDASHQLMQEEFFGPILAIMKCKKFSEAVAIAGSTEFALTAAVYSRNPHNLQVARDNLNVGNLYLNNKSTGAIVHRQPFGGFFMSGFGNKAGGPGYLYNFVDQRCVSENTMRRGFSPQLDN